MCPPFYVMPESGRHLQAAVDYGEGFDDAAVKHVSKCHTIIQSAVSKPHRVERWWHDSTTQRRNPSSSDSSGAPSYQYCSQLLVLALEAALHSHIPWLYIQSLIARPAASLQMGAPPRTSCIPGRFLLQGARTLAVTCVWCATYLTLSNQQ